MKTFQGKPLEWWYINLATRQDRMDHAEAQFKAQGIQAKRFDALLPSSWPGDPADVERMKNRTPGAIGCYLSQLSVIKKARQDSVVAVCEDDVCFAPDMIDRLNYAQSALPEDWDVFYLGATFHVPGEWYKNPECASWGHRGVDAEPTDDKHIMRVYGMWGTYAYFVNGANAQKVINALEENCHRSDGIDHNFMRLGDKLNAYCFVPGMAWQYDNQSNIGNGLTEFSGFKKLGPYVWTDNVKDFDPEKYDWKTGKQEIKVSFAVTAYKETTRGGPTILECIDAAVDHEGISEIVIVDDDSPDYKALAKLLSGIPKVKLFKNPVNLGVFGNKLAAVANSTGDWVINSDSDNTFSRESIDAVLSCDLSSDTWYCPSFARPVFDYRGFTGVYNASNIEEFINRGGMVDCFVNTGNQTVNRAKYMEVFGKYLHKRADLMFSNYLNLNDQIRTQHRWREVFNACDSLIFNSEWIKSGGSLAIVDGFEYDHYYTNTEDSNFNRAPQEKDALNTLLLQALGKKAPVIRPLNARQLSIARREEQRRIIEERRRAKIAARIKR